ncbi:MAG TPA: IS200/IS605 family transposase [Ktedonobacteraceae bacterium]|nr:IS200/IS605 family transposase [Ktedonobacteraceae bacterium]
MSTVVRRNANIIYNCHYHVVWCPKYRRKVLVNGIDERLKVLIQECVEKWQQEFVQVEVMPDHVHLLVGCDPQFGIHRLVKFIKGATAHQLRQEYPVLKQKLPSLWTNSYYCGTTGGVTLETVKRYVENQKGK